MFKIEFVSPTAEVGEIVKPIMNMKAK